MDKLLIDGKMVGVGDRIAFNYETPREGGFVRKGTIHEIIPCEPNRPYKFDERARQWRFTDKHLVVLTETVVDSNGKRDIQFRSFYPTYIYALSVGG